MDPIKTQNFISCLRKNPASANIDEIADVLQNTLNHARAGLQRANHAFRVKELTTELDNATDKITKLEAELRDLKPKLKNMKAEKDFLSPLLDDTKAKLKGKILSMSLDKVKKDSLLSKIDSCDDTRDLVSFSSDIEQMFRDQFLSKTEEHFETQSQNFQNPQFFKTGA
jgi:uncharacterized protein YpiB (UPF0302 family)